MESIQKIDPLRLPEENKWVIKLNREDSKLFRVFGSNYVTLKQIKDYILAGVISGENARFKILEYIRKNKRTTTIELRDKINISQRWIERIVKEFADGGCIKKNGINLEWINKKITEEDAKNEITEIAYKNDKKLYPIKSNYLIKIPKILDERLAKLLGIIISDGHIGKYNINVSGECSEEARKLGREIFGIDSNIRYENGLKRVDLESRALVEFVNKVFEIPKGEKSCIVFVPKLIFNSPTSVKAAFIAGLLEGDGTVSSSDIRLNTMSKSLASDIATLLFSMGIPSRIKKYNTYSVKPFGGYETFEKFYNCIYPWMSLQRKKEKLKALRERVKKISTIVYPIKEVLYNLRERYGVRFDDNKYRYLSPSLSYQINSNILGYILQKFEGIEDQVVQEIRRIQATEIVPVKIKSVSVTNGGEMFDMTTEFSNFIGGEIPTIIHNTLMDGLKSRGKVVVIAATNRVNAIDPALRRGGRFDREIEVGIPDKKGRKEIFQVHTRSMPLKDVDIDKLSEMTYGYVGADISALCKEAAMHTLRRVLAESGEIKKDEPLPEEFLKKLFVTQEDFDYAMKMVEPSAMREVMIETPNVRWEDIGDLEQAKKELKEAVEWPLLYPDSFKNIGINPPRGILLYGPPGCGKTLLAKAVAHESNANFILVNGPEILSKWYGESEKKLREIFQKAKQVAPCIIFFDEIDALAPSRGGTMHEVTERIVSQLLTLMSGLEELRNVFVLAATNRPDIIDPALLRPGRFDRHILIPSPDAKARLNILKIHTKHMPLAKNVDLEAITKKTNGFSGADLEELCREAGMNALRKDIKSGRVEKEDFEKALKNISPSISDKMNEAYKNILNRRKKVEPKQKEREEVTYAQ